MWIKKDIRIILILEEKNEELENRIYNLSGPHSMDGDNY